MAKPALSEFFTLAKDLRIGDRFGTSKTGDPVKIKVLNELCHVQQTPHVHVVTGQGTHCFPFNKVV